MQQPTSLRRRPSNLTAFPRFSPVRCDRSQPMQSLRELACLALFALGCFSAGSLAASERDLKQPNVLFVIVDQAFADNMSCAGNPHLQTPAMDSLAKNGVRFTKAYVNLPVCLPERYSMFTGRLPCTRRDADANHKPTISLGNQARQGGYQTAYFGKWHIQDQTFSTKDTNYNGFDTYVSGGDDEGKTTAAIKFLSEKKTKPFLAVVSYMNPHDICEWGRKKAGRKEGIKMKNGDVDAHPPVAECPPLPANFAINPDEAEAVTVRRTQESKGVPNAQKMAMAFTDNEWRQYRWAYNRLVEKVDQQIGILLKALEEQGLSKNTVVIFTSDHGDGNAAHKWHQKSVLYEESCRVPFIVSWPGKARKNETDDHLISVGIDMMATVSDIVGTAMPKGPFYGKSALPFVFDRASRAPSHAYVVSESEVSASAKKVYQGRALRTPEFNYHVWSQGAHREQLFDAVKDPGETRNLAADPAYAGQLERHRRLFAEWLKATDDTYGRQVKPSDDSER